MESEHQKCGVDGSLELEPQGGSGFMGPPRDSSGQPVTTPLLLCSWRPPSAPAPFSVSTLALSAHSVCFPLREMTVASLALTPYSICHVPSQLTEKFARSHLGFCQIRSPPLVSLLGQERGPKRGEHGPLGSRSCEPGKACCRCWSQIFEVRSWLHHLLALSNPGQVI